MISLEQVKLLETKVATAIEYVERMSGENAALLEKEAELQAKLDSYKKRIDELEVLVKRFKEDQGRIENGILSALDQLNKFENAIEKSLKEKRGKPAAVDPSSLKPEPQPREKPVEKPVAAEKPESKPADTGKQSSQQAAAQQAAAAPKTPAAPANSEIFFEIPEAEAGDVIDPLSETGKPPENGELDIF
ncbi:hypothetical protein AGMMS50293_12550 [Spirochaetia bacterium]|nr:hypothetical protein AGMMS50293_12550 [Spirochaetia bacterium]